MVALAKLDKMASCKHNEHVPTSVVDHSKSEKIKNHKRNRPDVNQITFSNACFSDDLETSRNRMTETSKSVASTGKTVSILLNIYCTHVCEEELFILESVLNEIKFLC